MKRKLLLVLPILLIIGFIVWNVITTPGVKDLPGNFKEQAFTRNEQNDGPVIRVYAVTVKGEYWKEMEQYGNYMPHTKYGNTKVYFFNENGLYPSKISLIDPFFEDKYKQNCIGLYEKNGMSQVAVVKYPFK